jgi:predicted transcriptional regulator of viral defense system
MEKLLEWYPNKSTLQRVGFLLEEIEIRKDFPDLIFNNLKTNKFFPVLLSPKSNEKAGAVYNKWKVDVNVKIESDL